ncbi:MAG: response regulator [Anaerolineales bacterium]|nr:response regulator [Anaerolineales bacterium]
MDLEVNGTEVNLQELRDQLLRRTVALVTGAGAGLAILSLPGTDFHPDRFLGLCGVTVVGLCAYGLSKRWPTLARHFLVWGLTVSLVIAMWWFGEPWMPLLGLLLPFLSAVIVSGGEFATASGVFAASVAFTLLGHRQYPLGALAAVLAIAAATAWLLVRTFYTALGWAWTMEQRADALLDEARDSRGQLSRALQSLEKTNWVLRRTQRELVLARQQADEARLMKEQFAANVSHELRTPLNLILGFSELMCVSPEVYGKMRWPAALRRDVLQVYRSSRHLLAMINDILDLSHFEIVGFTLDRHPTPIEPLLQEVLAIVEDLFKDRHVRLQAEIEPALPVLEVDPLRLRQVLLNLLNNAARFTERGEVRLSARRMDGELVISVTDTGPGIPAEDLPHMFEEFYQVDRSLHRRHQGAGLGLSISRHFVEAHKGRIWVESQEGQGSTFAFALPIPGQGVPISQLSRDRTVEALPSGERPAVLVVDPDQALATLVGRHLDQMEVVHWPDPESVQAGVALHHPRAVVYNVPPGALADRTLPAVAPAPLICCSLASQSWLTHELAATACLTKPITSDALFAEINRLGNVRDVLIVDDDQGFCHLVQRWLEASRRGLSVRRAYDGERGLEELHTQRPDLLLLDLMMPGMDGYEMMATIREDPDLADLPVVVLTATQVSEEALMRKGGSFLVQCADGLRTGEVLRCLRAVIGALEPRYAAP